MSDSRNDWKRELQRTPSCIPMERFSETLTANEQAHLAGCARCKAEMALFNEFENSETSAAEQEDVHAIVTQLESPKSNVVSLAARRRAMQPRWLAVAAMLAVAFAIGYIAVNREPSIERPIMRDLYRSEKVEVIAPVGDVAAAPHELQWKPAAGADAYEVVVSEVDGTVLWRTTTFASHVTLPDSVLRQLVPGKTIVWHVTSLRAGSALQSSGAQRFRVTVQHP